MKDLIKNAEDEKAGMKGVLTRLGVELKLVKTDGKRMQDDLKR